MTFLRFDERVASNERKLVQLDLQQALAELDPGKRPWSKAQAIIFLCEAKTWWVNTRLRVSVNIPSPGCVTVVPTQIATATMGTTWVLDQERFKILAPSVDVEALQTFFE